MKKKIVFLLVIAMLASGLTACGNEKNENDKSNLNSSSSNNNDDIVSSVIEDLEEAPIEQEQNPEENQVTSSITETPQQTNPDTPVSNETTPQQPTQQQTTPPATNDDNMQHQATITPNQPAPAPQTPPAKSPAVSDIANAIDKALGVDDSFMSFSADDISMNYGISSSSMAEFVGKLPMMNVKATEYLVVKAADGQVDAVKNGMLKRQADLDAQWKQYLPEQYELVKNYKLVANGNYVLFVIGENASSAVETFNSMTK